MVSPHNNNHNTTIKRAPKTPTKLEPAYSLLSPPPSPPQTSPPPPLSPVTMDRTSLHSAPERKLPPHMRAGPRPAFGNQDARSNFAVQPADNTGSLKLKKKAVKIVGAAGPAPSTPRQALRAPAPSSTCSTPAVASPVAGPVKAEPKEVER